MGKQNVFLILVEKNARDFRFLPANIMFVFLGNVRKKTCLVSVWDAKRPNMSFQCSQEKRSDFCSGYKGTRHVVFNARKKTNQIFVLFSMLARKRT